VTTRVHTIDGAEIKPPARTLTSRLGEFGFMLHPDHRGKGIAREALCVVIPMFFATLPIARLEANAYPRHTVALRLLSDFGFP